MVKPSGQWSPVAFGPLSGPLHLRLSKLTRCPLEAEPHNFTYVWTAQGWLYVAAVVDLFSRRVVGWSMSAAMTAQLVTDALVMGIAPASTALRDASAG